MTVVITGLTGIDTPGITGLNSLTVAGNNISAANSLGFRNRIINGGLDVWQRGTSFTLTSGATAYTADRFYVNTTGGAGNVSRVAGTGGFRYAMRITGASGVTSSFFGQKIESVNMGDLAGGSVISQIRLSASAARTVTWYARYPTTDDNYAGVTLITSGTINVTTTPTTYTFTLAVPAAATTGLEIYFDMGALGAGATVDVTGWQLEAGTVATPFERRAYGVEDFLCKRYFYRYTPGAAFPYLGAPTQNGNAYAPLSFPVTMRIAPSMTDSGPTRVTTSPSGNQIAVYQSAIVPGGVPAYVGITPNGFLFFIQSSSGVAAGQSVTIDTGAGYYWQASAEL